MTAGNRLKGLKLGRTPTHGSSLAEVEMWRAVEARDASADGRFVVAVRTTGIYCRPSCPSRHPRRENVSFYPDPSAAEAAGFRPCLRCKPRDETSPQVAWVRKTRDYIRGNSEKPIALADLERETGVSSSHLQRTFKRVIGVTPRQYREACRVDSLKARLRSGETVADAAHGVGYGSTSWLYADPTAKLGMTPGEYRRKGEGVEISYRIVDSPLGRLLVARTANGVCYVGLADTDSTLEVALLGEYPAAALEREEGEPDAWTLDILHYLEGRAARLGDIPLDVSGTGFQLRVWRELRAIPKGETRTYEQVARSLGKLGGARAVGEACAHNPVALLIPCHRVVRKGGDLGGYAWGVERKKALLEKEQ